MGPKLQTAKNITNQLRFKVSLVLVLAPPHHDKCIFGEGRFLNKPSNENAALPKRPATGRDLEHVSALVSLHWAVLAILVPRPQPRVRPHTFHGFLCLFQVPYSVNDLGPGQNKGRCHVLTPCPSAVGTPVWSDWLPTTIVSRTTALQPSIIGILWTLGTELASKCVFDNLQVPTPDLQDVFSPAPRSNDELLIGN
ncbi:uncharacterized protein BDZ83DRAFT_731033 [Colletotrichum acutatum]|uniref:Uncharacterized protein n=1 Tax=Glomerella acutata TaxID=27357 RepID=A0AAD8XH36_GLOAC|nr:uncharacterized protein BDZ83DRAFT_731033 [Colletotrichum acutatum]KAK1724588.1 hypothetical protein BDZ83DRAFT_731033 [Colletotrichum acutatum]